MLKKRYREYFTFTKKERNGIIVLLFLLLLFMAVRVYQNRSTTDEIVLMDEAFLEEIENFEKSLVPKVNKQKEFVVSDPVNVHTPDLWSEPASYFYFDPNEVSETELAKLGFTKKQIETLTNYRKKGGVFFKKEDLLKIYGIDEKQYEILEPYISIREENKPEFKQIVPEPKCVNINSASLDECMELKGIGNAFAQRIIKYRDLLGGYYKKEQILEVYGMDSSRYVGFINRIWIDTNQIVQINLNEADFKTFIKHPYLNKYQTEAILKYKELEGSFLSLEQLYQNKLLTKEEFCKLKPYLKL